MNQIWACEIEHLRTYCDKVLCADEETIKSAAMAFASRGPAVDILSVEGDTATIQITGTLTKQMSPLSWLFGMGGTTYSDILGAIKQVGALPDVKNVTLAIDSPGGNIAGLDDVWIALRDLGKSKTLIAENRGTIASAAYWIASAASRIVATSPIAMTGSIGVQAVVLDRSKEQSPDGIREIRIVSKHAPNKNPNPGTKEGEAVYQEMIDSMERVFLSRIAEGRGITAERVASDFGQGRMLVAHDPDANKPSAFAAGMIDHVQGISEIKSLKMETTAQSVDTINCDTAEISIGEMHTMTLAEMLNDPAVQAELKTREATAYERGVAETKLRGAKASAVLASNAYPDFVKTIAVAVIAGEKSPDVLEGAMEAVDCAREAEKQIAAEKETQLVGNTPAEPPVVAASDGEVRTEDDLRAAVNRARAAQGLQEIK